MVCFTKPLNSTKTLASGIQAEFGEWLLCLGGATNFNQDISSWDTSEVEDMECMFDYCPISEANKPLKCRKIQGD